MKELSKKQKLAIADVNRAMRKLESAGIAICGMDCDLLYATKEAILEAPPSGKTDGDYCGVARAHQRLPYDGRLGELYSGAYEDSGGW